MAFLSMDSSKFLQLLHLQMDEQRIPDWKHSQYFFKQADFLHAQPFECCFSPVAPSAPAAWATSVPGFPFAAAVAALAAAAAAFLWLVLILGRKALGDLSRVCCTADCLTDSKRELFWQGLQLQRSGAQ
eukprot:CAMPEP_0185576324 /NCGR_PEP_ID=MMETSP0434-20130131/7282_1 /TAXON_ID=626734 ORGANISM="Favella taraikaensis, Strain Fe Narragansett Bay" /NCGR_SAMPLE_ID=MMETSP0434 /ASSEMBLY_ACC=CAM_ASM_000379 /LENGTH=128 /DNA_ID=CAMNT_0028193483 /DNA_START=804 /DNA_END=1190 /DNA_ORIENTATION=+